MKYKGRDLLNQISIVPKFMLIIALSGGISWVLLDHFQTRKLAAIFEASMSERLTQQANEDRLRFDNYIGSFQQAGKLIAAQKSFIDYASNIDRTSGGSHGLKYYTDLPAWLPDASVMRHFASIDYALLIDNKDNVREIYQGEPGDIPKAFLRPSGLLRELSHNQSYMTSVDGLPFLITSETIENKEGVPIATLMLASQLDNDILLASHGTASKGKIVALARGERAEIIASNNPERLQVGTPLDTVKKDYSVTGKSFFDWGASDLVLQFISLISRDELKYLNASVMKAERLQRMLILFSLTGVFSMVLFCITRHINRLTHDITFFSEDTLDIKPLAVKRGDQLHILKLQFDNLTEEIILSRERLKRQAEELLREKTVYLDNILHSSALAIVAVDLDFKIKYYNPVAEQFFGYAARDIIGKSLADTNLDAMLNPPCFENAVNHARKDKDYTCTTTKKTAAGTGFLELRVSRILDNEGSVTGFLWVCQDITEKTEVAQEIKNLNRDLQLRASELESAYADMESFSYSVSHDLRAPLRIIGGLSEIVLKDYHDKIDDKGKNLLKLIQGNTKRMDQLVLAILDLSRIGRQEIRIDEIDMEKETALIADSLKTTVPERNIYVNIKELPPAHGDITLIRQVLTNLLSNALKFTKDKDVALIEVGGSSEGSENIYYVTDNGAGFDMEYSDKLFKVFQRLHTLNEFEGIGIGLSIVHRIIRRHGGRVWAEGKVNEGATFKFTLPHIK